MIDHMTQLKQMQGNKTDQEFLYAVINGMQNHIGMLLERVTDLSALQEFALTRIQELELKVQDLEAQNELP